MQNKPKINLYDIQVSRNTNHVLAPQKSISSIKIVLFSVLALTTLASIGQSFSAFDSKNSFADSQPKTSSISSSSRSRVAK
jgi:hypothetical protein